MISLGLLGKDIQHSKSQAMYEELLGQKIKYILFDFPSADEIPSLESFFEQVSGLSITAPYKKHFLGMTDKNDQVARLGAINCISKSGTSYTSTNTDFIAVKELLPNLMGTQFRKVILLGSGSMAQIVKQACSELDIPVDQIARKSHGPLNVFNYLKWQEASFVINSCSRSFLFESELFPGSFFWDFNYNQSEQQDFFQQQKSITYLDGIGLLKEQARHALHFWQIL